MKSLSYNGNELKFVNLVCRNSKINTKGRMLNVKKFCCIICPLLIPRLYLISGNKLTAPSYVSEWRRIDAMAPASSEVTFVHGFNIKPYKVEAQVKVGEHDPLVFPGMSSFYQRFNNVDRLSSHGGTIVIYNETTVKILVNRDSGSVIFTGMAGWSSVGSMAREFTSAHVRVRVWIPCDLPEPQFMTQWIDISTSDATVPMTITNPSVFYYPSLVVVQVMDDNGYIVEAQGSSSIQTVPENAKYGGVIYGFSKNEFKIWYPLHTISIMSLGYNRQGQAGVMCFPYGWDSTFIEFKDRAKIRILAWYFSTKESVYVYDPKNIAGIVPFPTSYDLDESLVVVEVEESSTNTNRFKYYGVGSTISDGEVDFGGYGGVIYGYTENETVLWVPSLTNGQIINIDGIWTDGAVIANNDVTITIKLFQMSHEEVCCKNDVTVNVTGTNVSVEGWNVNNKIQYMCQEGYRYVRGDLVRFCNINGSFSGDPPFCEEIFCDKRIELLNTSGLLTDITGFKYRDVLIYDCDNKTHSLVEGNIERKCQYDGSWSGKEPVCEACYCECLSQNITKEVFNEMIKEMTVPKNSTTRALRKLISPYEDRPSAKSMGFVAIIFLVFVLCCMVVPDIPKLIKHLIYYVH